jgi:hypothetical protein
MKKIILLAAVSVVVMWHSAEAQESYWSKPDSLFKFVQPTASLQLWSTYSMNERAQVIANSPLQRVGDRVSFMARRARIGFKGKPYKRLSYVLTIQYDNLGKDKFSAVRGGTNTGTLGILDAYVTWKATKNDWINVTTGYFQPQFSRECITGDLVVNSLDKSPSQTYIRQHITGKNYGRTTGVNVGGMKSKGLITVGYNAGIFTNNTTAADQKNMAESTGILWSPLTVERVMFTIGDPEMKTYAINYDANNYYSKRKGITLSAYSSQQGKTDIFRTNRSTGWDVLLNFKNLNLDGEWNFMERRIEGTNYTMRTGHIRAGYNVIVAKKYFLEPSFMIMDFTGEGGAQFSGHDRMYDAGVNWYLNKKNCKLSAHYIWQEGHGNNGFTDGVTFQKGNFAALAFVLMI